jgi:hypothetical protein
MPRHKIGCLWFKQRKENIKKIPAAEQLLQIPLTEK